MATILLCTRGPAGHSCSSLGPHPLHTWKVTFSSSTLGSPPPAGVLQWSKGGTLGDVFNSLCATSCQRSCINCLNWALPPRSPRSMWNWCRALPSGLGSPGGDWETSSLQGLETGCQRGMLWLWWLDMLWPASPHWIGTKQLIPLPITIAHLQVMPVPHWHIALLHPPLKRSQHQTECHHPWQ